MSDSLWKLLKQAELVAGDTPNDQPLESPWYVKILLAFSGWLAAIFILGFFFTLFSRLYKNTPLSISIGTALIAGAFIILKQKGNEFLEHLALAISLAGQALIVVGLERFYRSSNPAEIWLIIAIIQVPLALFMPNYVHRVFSSFIAGIGFAAALYYFQEAITAPTIYGAFLMLITALVWLNEFKFPRHIKTLQAIGYGLVLALIVIKASNIFVYQDFWRHTVGDVGVSQWFQPWMGELLLSLVTLFVVWKLLQKTPAKPSQTAMILALIGTLVLTLLSLEAQGLVLGVMILLLGFSASNRILIGLGVISLLFFVSSYYYFLGNTLLDKSITLLILGIALIAGHFLVQKFLPKNQTEGGVS